MKLNIKAAIKNQIAWEKWFLSFVQEDLSNEKRAKILYEQILKKKNCKVPATFGLNFAFIQHDNTTIKVDRWPLEDQQAKKIVKDTIGVFCKGAIRAVETFKKEFCDCEINEKLFHMSVVAGRAVFHVDENTKKFTLSAGKHQDSYENYGSSEIVNMLLGKDIEKLRLCDDCGKLFYAYHGKSLTCSDVCAGRQHTKKTREKPDSEEYNKLKQQKYYWLKKRGWTPERLARKWKQDGIAPKRIKHHLGVSP